METVETQWSIQDDNWEKKFISSRDMEQLAEKFRKQLSELMNLKKHCILQERQEELKQGAVKKEESFSYWQDLAKLEDEFQLVEVRNWKEEA